MGASGRTYGMRHYRSISRKWTSRHGAEGGAGTPRPGGEAPHLELLVESALGLEGQGLEAGHDGGGAVLAATQAIEGFPPFYE